MKNKKKRAFVLIAIIMQYQKQMRRFFTFMANTWTKYKFHLDIRFTINGKHRMLLRRNDKQRYLPNIEIATFLHKQCHLNCIKAVELWLCSRFLNKYWKRPKRSTTKKKNGFANNTTQWSDSKCVSTKFMYISCAYQTLNICSTMNQTDGIVSLLLNVNENIG